MINLNKEDAFPQISYLWVNFDKPTNWQKDKNWNDKLSDIWHQKDQELVSDGNLL